jgi:ubiquitin-like protein Pup
MAEQKRKVERPKGSPEGEGGSANPEVVKKGKKIKEDLDKLLDEIDDILEENAEEFVKSYVQRGGQ